jgi:hypothetical protein
VHQFGWSKEDKFNLAFTQLRSYENLLVVAGYSDALQNYLNIQFMLLNPMFLHESSKGHNPEDVSHYKDLVSGGSEANKLAEMDKVPLLEPIILVDKEYAVDFDGFIVIKHGANDVRNNSQGVAVTNLYQVGWKNFSFAQSWLYIEHTEFFYGDSKNGRKDGGKKSRGETDKPQFKKNKNKLRIKLEFDLHITRQYINSNMRIIGVNWADYHHLYFIIHIP